MFPAIHSKAGVKRLCSHLNYPNWLILQHLQSVSSGILWFLAHNSLTCYKTTYLLSYSWWRNSFMPRWSDLLWPNLKMNPTFLMTLPVMKTCDSNTQLTNNSELVVIYVLWRQSIVSLWLWSFVYAFHQFYSM